MIVTVVISVFFPVINLPHSIWSYCSSGKLELLFKQISKRQNFECFTVHCTDVFINSSISMFLSLNWPAVSTRWLQSVKAGPNEWGQSFIDFADGDNGCFCSVKGLCQYYSYLWRKDFHKLQDSKQTCFVQSSLLLILTLVDYHWTTCVRSVKLKW